MVEELDEEVGKVFKKFFKELLGLFSERGESHTAKVLMRMLEEGVLTRREWTIVKECYEKIDRYWFGGLIGGC